MDWLLILGLCAVCYAMWQKQVAMQQRLDRIEGALDQVTHGMRSAASDRPAEQPETVRKEPAEEAAKPIAESVSLKPRPATVSLRAMVPTVKREPSAEGPAAQEPEAKVPRFSFDLEDIFGRRLPIWAGGVTLAIAGVFLVRHSIEAGLLTPVVRVALSFLFGIALLCGAEAAYRFEDRVGDDRVRQALAGAGLATLYAGFYLAGTQYGLIGQTFAFLGLAVVTALAIVLSYRFGLPSAVLGLLGGFAAPALVGGEDANLPMLALYLALVTGGLTQTGNRQRRPWLGIAALAGGLGWGALLLATGDYGSADLIALGLYFVVVGTIVPALLDVEQFQQPIRLAAAGLASLQLAFLVDKGGYEPLTWGLYLLLGAAITFFGWRKPELRGASAMAAAVGLFLLAIWPDPLPVEFALVTAALVALFAAVPLTHLARSQEHRLDRWLAAAVPLVTGLITVFSFDTFLTDTTRIWEALACLALAALPLAAARLLWTRNCSFDLACNLASGGLLAFIAAACLLPNAALPFVASGLTLALAWLSRERAGASRSLTSVLWLGAFGAFLALVGTGNSFTELKALTNGAAAAAPLSLLRWVVAMLPWAAIAVVGRNSLAKGIAEAIAALLVFGALAQVLPPIALVWSAAAILVAIRWRMPARWFAAVALLACMAAWAIPPIGEWLAEGGRALWGDPMMLPYMPGLRTMIGFVLPLAVGFGVTRIEDKRFLDRLVPFFWAALPLGLMVAHTLFKQVLAIDSQPDFVSRGLAERTVWEGLLLALAWAAARGVGSLAANRTAAIALAGMALVHFVWFTGVLHNPLWDDQAVGQVPLANLALAAYAVGIATLVSLRQWLPKLHRACDIAVMGVATLGAITLLRQLFSGSILTDQPMSQTEDLLRSVVGIVLAIVFLLIGSRRNERVWRVGSLVLMIATLIKVFWFDTAGLEGLLRVASFVALGASLIGIGWFYSRQLRAAPQTDSSSQ